MPILSMLLALLPLAPAQSAPAQGAPPHVERSPELRPFVAEVLDLAFRSEGVATADFDRDGDLDVLAGEFLYLAPDWARREIAPPGQYDPVNNYAASFVGAAFDVDGDGWTDALSVGFPGGPCHWYRNPQGAAGHWQKHLVVASVSNESPRFADVDGDDRLDLVCGIEAQQQLAWLEPRPDPTQPWRVHPLSVPGTPGYMQFHHGLGFDDVDLDGRPDVLVAEGWHGQPADIANLWTFHRVDWHGSSAQGPQGAAQIEAFDVDGDGDQDVVTSSPHAYGLWWWEQVAGPAAPFVEHLIANDVSQTHALVAADVDADGDRDLVTGKRWYAHGPSGDPGSQEPAVLDWYELANGPGGVSFTRHRIDADSGIGVQFEVVDVDGDGRLDVVVSNKKGVRVHFQR